MKKVISSPELEWDIIVWQTIYVLAVVSRRKYQGRGCAWAVVIVYSMMSESSSIASPI